MTIGLGLLANTFLILGSWWIAGCALRQVGIRDRVLASSIVALTWCFLGLECLGSFGVLSIVTLFLWASALLGAGLSCQIWIGPRSAGPRPLETQEPWRLESVIALGLMLWTCSSLGLRSLLLPIQVVSDGPIYHLYFAVRWWKAGRLFLVPIPFGESAATYFPANGDLWFTWLMASWGGDRLARAGQVPFLALAATAAYGLARRLGAGRNSSLIATCWFVSVVPLLIFSFEGNVDTIFVAGYLMAAYFFVGSFQGRDRAAGLMLGGLSAGMALGTKSVGVVLVPPLLVLVLLVQAFQSRSALRTLTLLVMLLGPPLLNCGFWYGRNLWLTGNPIYPLNVGIWGTTYLHGWYGPEAMQFSPYYLPVRDWRSLIDTMLAVLDPRLLPVWMLAVTGGWAVGSRRSEFTREGRWVWGLSLLGLVNIALYWLCLPYRTQQRFMLQAVGLWVPALALLFDRARGLTVVGTLLLGLHLMTSETWPFAAGDANIPWDLSPIIPNTLPPTLPVFARIVRGVGESFDPNRLLSLLPFLAEGCFAGLTAITVLRPYNRRFGRQVMALLALLALVLLAALDTGALGADRRQLFYPPFLDFYQGWMHLEARSGVAGARVAYAGTNIPYYLQGVGLRNDVRYVNVDAHRDWLLHDYHQAAMARGEPLWPNPRPGWDRAHPDYLTWVDNLRTEGIQLLVVTKVNRGEGPHNVADAEGFPIERGWADAHPDVFQSLYGERERDPWFRLYRVRTSSP
jgi:hypothetical protein